MVIVSISSESESLVNLRCSRIYLYVNELNSFINVYLVFFCTKFTETIFSAPGSVSTLPPQGRYTLIKLDVVFV